MKTIPLLDFASPVLAALFAILLWLQWRFPLRRQHFAAIRRVIRNLVLSAPSHAVLRFAMLPIPIALASWAQHRHFGLLNVIAMPVWARVGATFLLMDYAYW